MHIAGKRVWRSGRQLVGEANRPTHGGFPIRVLSLLHIAGPGIDFGLGFFGREFVVLLEVALELRASALNNIKIFSELAPLRPEP